LKEFDESQPKGEDDASNGKLPPGPEATEQELLQAQLEETEREKIQFKSLAQRLQADFVNFRKRADDEKLEIVSSAKSQVILHILPALDDVERGLNQSRQTDSEADNAWLEGFKLIQRKLVSILQSEGLQRIEAEGTVFNPLEHEIISYLDVPDRQEGEILEVTRQGYKINGKVLRPSQVVVAKPLLMEITEEPTKAENN